MIITSEKSETTLIIEPWAEEFILKKGSYAEITLSKNVDFLPSESHDNVIVITAPPGVSCKVFIDGKYISNIALDIPSP